MVWDSRFLSFDKEIESGAVLNHQSSCCDMHLRPQAGPESILHMCVYAAADARLHFQGEIREEEEPMTVLIAWTSLSVGIVMGALWRSLCETQSRSNLDTGLTLQPHRQHYREPQRH